MAVDDMAVIRVEAEFLQDVSAGCFVFTQIVIRVFLFFMRFLLFNEIPLKGCQDKAYAGRELLDVFERFLREAFAHPEETDDLATDIFNEIPLKGCHGAFSEEGGVFACP
jgi:hypothetical protein